ncbi:MAG: dTMP kinase [Proteobacteria bacterium]|nr:dTMP kinase [Pseudomonadota bacterium]
MKGRLISVEGGEGAGKSSAMAAIGVAIAARGVEVVSTREPGGTAVGEAIRGLLLDPAHAICANSELLLMFAARAQHVCEVILPALERGAWVLSDRYTDASFAYQGGGRGIDPSIVAELERWAVGIKPDLTVLLDVDVHRGHARLAGRGGERDRIEREREDFFERVRAAYRQRAKAEPQRFRVIDASQTQASVTAAVLAALDEAATRWT